MVTGRGAAKGLSNKDIEQLRELVDAGRKPKVVFTANAGQVAGQVGQVVRLEDPATSDEWVVVRFGRDELPFSPSDVAIPVPEPKKAPAPVAAATARAETVTAPAPASGVGQALSPVGGVPAPANTAGDTAASNAGTPTEQSRSTVADPAPAKPAARKAKAKPASAELNISLTCADGQWTVQASRGNKVVAKPAEVRATDALRMVELLDVPALTETVEDIVASVRAKAEEEAEQLRRQLAEVEARLAELHAN